MTITYNHILWDQQGVAAIGDDDVTLIIIIAIMMLPVSS